MKFLAVLMFLSLNAYAARGEKKVKNPDAWEKQEMQEEIGASTRPGFEKHPKPYQAKKPRKI